MGRSSVFSLEQIYRKQITQTWSKIPEVFKFVKDVATSPKGYFAGGSTPSRTSRVDRIDFDNDTLTASHRGPLTDVKNYTAGTSSLSGGYIAGDGIPFGEGKSTVDRIDYSNDLAVATAKGKLGWSTMYAVGTGNKDFGYVVGGFNPSYANAGTLVNRIDYTNDTATATPKGPLAAVQYSGGAAGNQVYGYIGGGSPTSTGNTIVQRIEYANDTTSSLKGNLSVARYGIGVASNKDYAWFGGGAPPSPGNSTVDRIDFASDTSTASVRGPLAMGTGTNGAYYIAATGNQNFGYWAGGSPNTTVINRVEYANDTATAVRKGQLTAPNPGIYAASGVSCKANANPDIISATRTETGLVPVGTDFGYVIGGSPTPTGGTRIFRLDFNSDTTTASPKGAMNVNRYATDAVSSTSHGYVCGGYSSPGNGNISSIDRIDYSDDTTTASPKGNLNLSGNNWAAAGNASYGWIVAGEGPGYRTAVSRIDYSNDDTTTNLRTNTDNKTRLASVGNLNYGYFAGGQSPVTSRVVRLDYANDTTWGTTKGPLANGTGYHQMGAGNISYGYIAGGDPSRSSVTRIDYSNDSAVTSPKGNLSANMKNDASIANSSYGYFAPGPSGQPNKRSMDRIDFANDTATASPRGNIINDADNRMGTSSRENGLGPIGLGPKTVDKGADGFTNTTSSLTSSGPAFGYFTGGEVPNTSSVDRIDYGSDTSTASPKGTLDRNRWAHGAASSPAYGYLAGGNGSGQYTTVSRIDYGSDTSTASPKGNLSDQHSNTAGTGNASYGYIGGGNPPTRSTIDRIDYSNDTATAVAKGPLGAAKGLLAAAGNLSYGYWGAGSPGFGSISTVDRLDYSNDTAATSPKGPLSGAKSYLSALGTPNYGYFAGGEPLLSTVDRIDFANDTAQASPKGALNLGRHEMASTGNANFGYFGGGMNPNPSQKSTVDRIDFANDTETAVTVGSLTRTARSFTAVSAQENGLSTLTTTTSFIPRVRFTDNIVETVGQSPNFGYFGGGYPSPFSSIDRIDFDNDSSTVVRGSIATPLYAAAATGNKSFGYIAGGQDPSSRTSRTQRIDYSNDDTSTSPKGNLSAAKTYHAAVGNNSYGYYAAGMTPSLISSVDRVDFANDTATASPKGPVYQTKAYLGGAGNQSYGYIAGGGSGGDITDISRIDYSNDTAAALEKGHLNNPGVRGTGATSNHDFGYFSGGFISPGSQYSKVERLSFFNDTMTASHKTNLSSPKYINQGATGSSSFGYIAGGGVPTNTSIIDRIDYANDTGSVTAKGPLVQARLVAASTSSRENALPVTATSSSTASPNTTVLAAVQPPFAIPTPLIPPEGPLDVNSLFAINLYTGNGLATSSNRDITIGIDFAFRGGLIWIKNRSRAISHVLQDTSRGAGASKRLASDSSDAANSGVNDISGGHVSTFTSTGFSLNNGGSTSSDYVNRNGDNYVAWCFRKKPGFFDIQTWTGDGTNDRKITHDLDSVPGAIWIKTTSSSSQSWVCYHRGIYSSSPEDYYLTLDGNAARINESTMFNDTAPTSTQFTLGTNDRVNKNGDVYVAYIFGHNDARFGTNSDKAIIQCGSYTGTGSAGNTVTIGWQAQWILFKNTANSSMNWRLYDTTRGIVSGTDASPRLMPNLTNAEETLYDKVDLTSDGFQLKSGDADMNESGSIISYIAIRGFFGFDHENSTTIEGTIGGHSRTATYCDPPNDLATGITYGSQNSTPFNTSTDWNNEIVRAYGYGKYANRDFAPIVTALMERPPQGGTWPSSVGGSSWETAWWLNSSGDDDEDILIVVFDEVKSFSGIEFGQFDEQQGNADANARIYAAAVTGSASSFSLTTIGDVSWNAPGSNARTISAAFQAQAIAIWRDGATTWSRLETVRFLK